MITGALEPRDMPPETPERHLRYAITEYVEHYHEERNHQGLENRLIVGRRTKLAAGRIRRRTRLGGLLNFYARAA